MKSIFTGRSSLPMMALPIMVTALATTNLDADTVAWYRFDEVAPGVPVSFHNPSGPISNAAILQLAATTPNFLIHEMMLTDGSFRKLITDENVKFEDGYLVIGDKPGLGIDVNVEEIEKRPYTPRMLRHYTGTLTDIRPKGDTFYYFDGLDCENPVF